MLAGIDAASTYCYLLEGVEQRDADTLGRALARAYGDAAVVEVAPSEQDAA